MRVLTTDDLRKILEVNKDIKYFGLYPSEMSDEKIIEVFKVLIQAFLHSNSKHYYSILDEPRF